MDKMVFLKAFSYQPSVEKKELVRIYITRV